MQIAETEFHALINEPLLQLLRTNTDTLIHFIRKAAEELTTETWDNNQRILDTGASELFDCYFFPLTTPGGQAFRLEITPFPRGVLLVSLAGHPETVPDRDDPTLLVISSGVVMNAPLTEVLIHPTGQG